MALHKHQSYLVLAHKRTDGAPMSPSSAEEIAIELLLDELAEIIESEGGILIP